jgi:hypothetical protein
MGKASRRKTENRELKRANPEQFAQSLGRTGSSYGIDPASSDPAAPVVLALGTDQAEQRWLAGEDIFADIHRDPEDAFANPQAQMLYRYAFPGAPRL